MSTAWEIIAAYTRGDVTHEEAREQLRFIDAPSEMFLGLPMSCDQHEREDNENEERERPKQEEHPYLGAKATKVDPSPKATADIVRVHVVAEK